MQTTKQIPQKQTQINKLRIIPIGGLDEVGRNMTIVEYKNNILIIDMGLQFPDEDMPGIDYIIPNIDYLRGKEGNIRGVILTHGHMDHIGAIPHLMQELGNPPIFTAALTRGMILKKQEEYPKSPKLKIKTIKPNDKIDLKPFKLEFFHVNHSIPDALGIVIQTPEGAIVHTGDFKFDHSPITDKPADIARIAEIGNLKPLVLMSDSTDAETPGYSVSEREIQNNLEDIFKRARGRIIAVTFSSLIARVQEIVNLAEKYQRKLVLDGYSMRTNAEIALKLKYLKIKPGTLIKTVQANKMQDRKVVVLATGAQGEENASLMRIVNREHKYLQIHKADTVVLSSSVIPGNERTVQGLKDALYRQGARVVDYKMMGIHAGGHAREEDLKMMLNLIKPKFFIPIHGTYYMRKVHGEIAQSVDIPWQNIFVIGNGTILEFSRGRAEKLKEKANTNYVMVDGLGVGDVKNVVIRDRQMMGKDGMFVIIVIVQSKTHKIYKSPQIMSRGFVYVKDSAGLMNETKKETIKIVEKNTSKNNALNWSYLQKELRNKIGEFLYKKTQKRPMVLPMVVEV
ncbi:ribonuclease J [bacterium]|nr:ribonuclease J [bacterium]